MAACMVVCMPPRPTLSSAVGVPSPKLTLSRWDVRVIAAQTGRVDSAGVGKTRVGVGNTRGKDLAARASLGE
jgi:hypothetical protein